MSSVKLANNKANKDKNINKKRITFISISAVAVTCILGFVLYQTKVFGPTERQIAAEAEQIGLSVSMYKSLRGDYGRQVKTEDLQEITELVVESVDDIQGISNIPNIENVVILNQEIAPAGVPNVVTHIHEDGTVHVENKETTIDLKTEEKIEVSLSELNTLENLKSVTLYGDNFNYESFFDTVENPESIESFSIANSSINNLVGIEKLTNLRELSLTHCYELSNIENIANLKELESLKLHGSYTLIESISGLTNIKNLAISSNTLDLTGLSKLDNIETLIVCAKTIYNIDELNKLESLTDLSLLDADLTEIPYMENLNKLYLQNLNNIDSLDSVFKLKNLKDFRVSRLNLLEQSDLKNIKTELPQLENLSIHNCEKLNSEKKEITLNNID